MIETELKESTPNEIIKTEAMDEQQIIDEMQGRIIDQYFYEFEENGRTVTGLSWAGVKYIATKMAAQGHPISMVDMKLEEKDDRWTVTVASKDLATGEQRYAYSSTKKLYKSGAENMFAAQTTLNKGQRNAIRVFIPEAAIVEAFKEWKARKDGKVIDVGSAPSPIETKPGQPNGTNVPKTSLARMDALHTLLEASLDGGDLELRKGLDSDIMVRDRDPSPTSSSPR